MIRLCEQEVCAGGTMGGEWRLVPGVSDRHPEYDGEGWRLLTSLNGNISLYPWFLVQKHQNNKSPSLLEQIDIPRDQYQVKQALGRAYSSVNLL